MFLMSSKVSPRNKLFYPQKRVAHPKSRVCSYYLGRGTHKELVFIKKSCRVREISVHKHDALKNKFHFERLDVSPLSEKKFLKLDLKYSSHFQSANMRSFERTQVFVEKNDFEKGASFTGAIFCPVL